MVVVEEVGVEMEANRKIHRQVLQVRQIPTLILVTAVVEEVGVEMEANRKIHRQVLQVLLARELLPVLSVMRF